MPSTVVHVTAASRLHFGLITLGGAKPRVFGGVGVMVEPPNIRLRIESAENFSVEGANANRVTEFVTAWQQYWQKPNRPPCRIVLETIPRMHTGLGVGTQLALSVACGLNTFWNLDNLSPEQLAACVGRGARSAVGTHGFFRGGLIYEIGKAADETLAPLAQNIALPEAWRFVLIALRDAQGLYGGGEQQAFGDLPEFPSEVSESLRQEAEQRLVPAAMRGDFEQFSESVYQFGYQSGLGFAAIQGGAYNGERISHIVQRIRSHDVRCVGQSSWGPAIFAGCADQSDADSLVAWTKTEPWSEQCDIWIARPCNHGAVVWLN
jgi:beta-ribofuranosylaminobenzene 5'-phosphate synthase